MMLWNHSYLKHRLPFVVAAVICASSLAQEWSVTTADFAKEQVQLRGLSSDGLRVASPETKTERVIPLVQFVSLQRLAGDEVIPPVLFTLAMRGGDRLVGEPGSVVNEKLNWLSPSLGKVSVPFSSLVAISRGLNFSVPDETPKQDLVTLSNGDTVGGVFIEYADHKITLQADAGPASIPIDSVKRIAFAASGAGAFNEPSRAFRIHLTDSSIFTAADARIDATRLKLTLPGKNAQSVDVPLSSVLEIEQLNGPVGWLSSVRPTENIQTPYLGGSENWPARFDLSVDGSPLSFAGRSFDHGIGVHAYSRLSFAIDPQWKVFRTQYAIDSHRDEPRKFADVTLRIKLDDKVVHEEKHFREGVLSPAVVLNLNGARVLTLECDYGDAGDTQAHLNWLQAAFLHERPAPITTATLTTQPATAP